MRYLILVHMTLGEPLTAMEIHDRIFQGSGRTVVVYIPTLYAALKILEQEKLLGRNRPRTHAETPGEGEDGGDDEVRYHLRSEAIPLVAEDVASYTHLAKLGRAFIRRSEVKETASE